MNPADQFDAFYKDTRTRLLLQTYALTGDLPGSRSAVRDSFIHAWHHWRKVSRLEDPEAWIRPHAWGHAQRRHSARIWHRDKGLDAEVRTTLEALGRLPVAQRRPLLLTMLSSESLDSIAREIGLPRGEAERLLQTATAQFAVHRDVPTTSVRPLLEALREPVADVAWPRPTILRRAGTARRRTHTLVGVAATLAALVVSGTVATDLAGSRPTLARADAGASSPSTGQSPAAPLPMEFSADALLSAEQVGAHVPGRDWVVTETTDNSSGDGLMLPCQQERYADPRGRSALVRRYEAAPPDGETQLAAFQSAELSGSAKAAERAYGTSLRWFGGCTDRRARLVSTHRVDGVGDEALMLVLQTWPGSARTLVVGVARTGRLTSSMVLSRSGTVEPELEGPRDLLAAAVDSLCAQAGAGTCADEPDLAPTTPVPVGVAPGMLAEVDLPTVPPVRRPWVGTEPRRAMDNVAATQCDAASFSGEAMSNNLTRTFLIPGARLPKAFGLTETVGTLPERRARAFVAAIRRDLLRCPDRDLGTDVVRLAHAEGADSDLSAWRVRMELNDQSSVTFLMGIVREGTALAQVGFVPGPRVTMASAEFVGLVRRAGERLAAMPPPA